MPLASLFDQQRLFSAALLAVAIGLALALPYLVITLAPPAPGASGFLIWF